MIFGCIRMSREAQLEVKNSDTHVKAILIRELVDYQRTDDPGMPRPPYKQKACNLLNATFQSTCP